MDSVLTVTAAAVEKALLVRSREDDPDRFALWVEVVAGAYDLSLQPLADAPAGAHVEDLGRIALVIPAESVDALRGATLDRRGDLLTGGLVIDAPRPASPPLGVAPEGLTGPVADRVARVLDEQINPAIAAHGGTAELVAVQDGAAYLRLGGGCVGCGMVAVTLTQGIEAAILDAVPEIERIVDVTDHAAGTNPYYEAAAK